MEKPALLMHVEKAPRKGHTFDCTIKPKISIGRVVKGNTFTIKENAISQKHLLIEFNNNQWTLSDLDTSNGTILNDVRLPPHDPQNLKNGDIVKIGYETVIRVEIRSGSSLDNNKTLKSRRKAEGIDKKAEVGNEVEENRFSRGEMGENVILGEWFDRMEEWLPKHLSQVADTIITEIREQSQQLDAYICQKYQK